MKKSLFEQKLINSFFQEKEREGNQNHIKNFKILKNLARKYHSNLENIKLSLISFFFRIYEKILLVLTKSEYNLRNSIVANFYYKS